jgi:hypothetical protein
MAAIPVPPTGGVHRLNASEAVPRPRAMLNVHMPHRPDAPTLTSSALPTVVHNDIKLSPYVSGQAGGEPAVVKPSPNTQRPSPTVRSTGNVPSASVRPLSAVLLSPSEGATFPGQLEAGSVSSSNLISTQAARFDMPAGAAHQPSGVRTPEKVLSRAVHTPSSLLVKSKPASAGTPSAAAAGTGVQKALLSTLSQLSNMADMIQVAQVIANKLGSLPNEGAYAEIIDKARTLDATILCYAPSLTVGSPVAGVKRSQPLTDTTSGNPHGLYRNGSHGVGRAAPISKRVRVDEPRVLFDSLTS